MIPRADGFQRDRLAKVHPLNVCGFDGSERSPARWTPLIWILWSFDSCASSAASRRCTPPLVWQRCAACRFWVFVDCFWFGFSCLLVSFGFPLPSFWVGGFHHSFFFVRIKIGANMAAAGWRLRGVSVGWQHCQLDFFFGFFFWLILNLFLYDAVDLLRNFWLIFAIFNKGQNWNFSFT